MRTSWSLIVAAAAVAGAVVAGTPAQAQEYPWCVQYGGGRGGGRNCGFVTWGQCMAAMWGNGGFCERNLFYRGPYFEPYERPYPRRPYRGY